MDVLFDADGRAVDYRVLATEPGVRKADRVGWSCREDRPRADPRPRGSLPEIYGTVATTGESIRFEQRSDAAGAWFEVFATRVGPPGSHLVAAVFKDVSDRRATLDAVQASEARYRQLADALPQLVWTALPDGRVDYVNRRWLDYTGISPQEVGARGWEDQVYDEDRPQASAAWRQARLSEEPFERKLRYRDAAGEWRWHLVRGVPAKDDAGRVTKWFGTTTDIHDSEMQEQDSGFLSRLSERLRLSLDPDALLAEVPATVGPYLGLSRCCFAEVSAADDRWTVQRDYARGLRSFAGEYPLSLYGPALLGDLHAGKTHAIDDALSDPRTADGFDRAWEPHGIRALAIVPFLREGRWTSSLVAATTTPHVWHARERVLLETIAERTWNVIEKIRLDVALRRSEALYRSVVELALDGIYLAEQNGRFIDVNPAGAAMLGYTREELVQRSVADLVRPEDEDRLQALLARLGAGEHVEEEWAVRHKDGRYVPIEFSIRFTPDGRWQAIGRDVSERRRGQARNQFLLRLQDDIRALTDPAAIMAAATSLLGRHLGVSRCAYADVDADGNHFTIPSEYSADHTAPALTGTWTLEGFGPHVAGELRAGRTLVVRDYRRELPDDAGGVLRAWRPVDRVCGRPPRRPAHGPDGGARCRAARLDG